MSGAPTLTTLTIGLAVLSMVILGPIVEELIFRGLLFGALAPRLGVLASALITALIFGGHGFAQHPLNGAVHGKTWLGLEVNGWSALLFIAAGLLLLLAAPMLATAMLAAHGCPTSKSIFGPTLGAGSFKSSQNTPRALTASVKSANFTGFRTYALAPLR